MCEKDDFIKEGEIEVCSMCGSREKPFTAVREPLPMGRYIGVVCSICLALEGDAWLEAIKPLISKK